MNTASSHTLVAEPTHTAPYAALITSEPNSRIPTDLRDLAARHAWATSLPDAVRLNNWDASTFLTAHGLHIAPSTLETWRSRRSDGPEFTRFGRRICYEVGALRRYLRIQNSAAA